MQHVPEASTRAQPLTKAIISPIMKRTQHNIVCQEHAEQQQCGHRATRHRGRAATHETPLCTRSPRPPVTPAATGRSSRPRRSSFGGILLHERGASGQCGECNAWHRRAVRRTCASSSSCDHADPEPTCSTERAAGYTRATTAGLHWRWSYWHTLAAWLHHACGRRCVCCMNSN